MSDFRFALRLTEQIANEFAASQQYIAIAVHYDADALPQLAGLFYRQSVEERNHAMIMVQYLLDADEAVVIPGVEAPQTSFSGIAEPVALALDQERRVSDQCADLVRVARESGDFAGEQFMQWFIKEQIEEVAKMSTLLRVVERAGDDALRVEEFLAREGDGGDGVASEPGMPAAAGGASALLTRLTASATAPGAARRSARPSGVARTARAAGSRATSTPSRPSARSCSTTRAACCWAGVASSRSSASGTRPAASWSPGSRWRSACVASCARRRVSRSQWGGSS